MLLCIVKIELNFNSIISCAVQNIFYHVQHDIAIMIIRLRMYMQT